jgi:hypothetical protein
MGLFYNNTVVNNKLIILRNKMNTDNTKVNKLTVSNLKLEKVSEGVDKLGFRTILRRRA